MQVRTLPLGSMRNLVYLIEDPATRRAAVVDPGWDVEAILTAAEKDFITDILITHWHDDHINGVDELVDATGAPVHLLAVEADYWGVHHKRLIRHEDDDPIWIGSLELRILHTPGHSPGAACYYADGALFSGDTLFIYGCGRCDLPGGDPRALYHSLCRLMQLAPDTLLYPGHDYAEQPVSTLGEQLRLNPFLHQDSVAAFVAFRAEHNRHRQPPYQPVPRGEPAW